MSEDDTNDDDDFDLPSVVMEFKFNVRLIRVVDTLMMPSRLAVRAAVIPEGDDKDEDIDVAFTKIKFWFDTIVARSIAVSRANASILGLLVGPDGNGRTANHIMLTPEDPSDEHLAAIFQSKMCALSDGVLSFGDVRIASDNVEGLEFTFCGDSTEVLPDMEDWIGERSYFDEPWWDRDDASTLDVVPPEDADLTKPPAWAFSLDFLRTALRPNPAGGQILRPAFRPTIHDGGKK